MDNNINKMESSEILPNLWEIKEKINNPDTSWWELTWIRDDLKESIHKQALIDWLSDAFADMIIAYIAWSSDSKVEDEKESKELKEMKLMLSLTQSRINSEEPSDIKAMRKELTSIEMELSNSAKTVERIQTWDFDGIYTQLLSTIKIDMSSRWITDFEQYIRSTERLFWWSILAMLENSNEIFSDYSNLMLLWVDLTHWWKVDESTAMSYFDYAVNWLNSSSDDAEKLTYMTMLLLANN